MKRFIVSLSVFAVIIMGLDIACGAVCKALVSHAKGGETGLSNYICNDLIEDCVIMGSSRAMHHYDPKIIEDSLKMSCYNCGLDGNGIILMYGRYLLMSEKKAPKLLIYDVTEQFDLDITDNHTFLPGLRYYYDRPGISGIFIDVDLTEKYKMISQCYRYNSTITNLLADYIHPLRSADNGYRPVDKIMEYETKRGIVNRKYEYDGLKLQYLQNLINECRKNGTKMIFTLSPEYKCIDDSYFQPLKELCAKNNLPLLNHLCDEKFIYNKEYFYDSFHLNTQGATVFSVTVASEISNLINI